MLFEQVDKMKVGLHRLQEIAFKFNQGDSFKKNVDLLTKHLKPDTEKKDVEPAKKT